MHGGSALLHGVLLQDLTHDQVVSHVGVHLLVTELEWLDGLIGGDRVVVGVLYGLVVLGNELISIHEL